MREGTRSPLCIPSFLRADASRRARLYISPYVVRVMVQSGLRETISTRGNSFPARSRIVGSVSGKFIIVPGIVTRFLRLLVRASYHFSPPARFSSGFYRRPPPNLFWLQKVTIFESISGTTEIPPPARHAHRFALLAVPVYQCAPQSWLGSGQKASPGEEALRR